MMTSEPLQTTDASLGHVCSSDQLVTRKMIGAAHDVMLAKGDFVLSAALLERIYLAMDAKRHNAQVTGQPKAGPG